MTCIVGIVEDGVVYMGGDSATTSGWDKSTTIMPKVFSKGGMLIGGTGTIRLLQLLQYALVIPERPEGMSLEHYFVTLFVDSVRDCFKNAGLAEKEGDREKYYGSFLVGHEGRLVKFDSGYGLLITDLPYMAIGSGEDYARGSLFTSDGLMFSPERRIEIALDAASRFAVGVGAPYHILNDRAETLREVALTRQIASTSSEG